MKYLIRILPYLLVPAVLAGEPSDSGKPSESGKKESPAPEAKAPVVREAQVVIDGKTIPYKSTTGKIQLKTEDGKVKASVFHVTYERTDVKDVSTRPVMFAFNGGPGSSAVWLHIGVLGPRILNLPGDGTTAPVPPARVRDNPSSLLDVCDLVFVDPVSTGYSRTEKDGKPSEFHGLNEDVESVGDFIRRWVGEHGRWSSPKYLLGESYGGVRVAGLSRHLQSRFGMNLNGVVLMSSLLDFGTLDSSAGSDLGYLTFLPSFTGVAHFHGKIKGDRDKLIDESREFAFGPYAAALLKGNTLDDRTRDETAATLARLTGIAASIWQDRNLRMDASVFRAELLRAEGKVIGRFDARVAWETADKTAASVGFDPSYSLAYGAFTSAMMDYLSEQLGYKEEIPYEIIASVGPWNWSSQNQIVNVSDRLSDAMRQNPHLRVLVMGGRTDLATPPAGIEYSLNHMLDLPAGARERISKTAYDAGHMFYLNAPDLVKCRKDLVDFIRQGK